MLGAKHPWEMLKIVVRFIINVKISTGFTFDSDPNLVRENVGNFGWPLKDQLFVHVRLRY